MKSWLDSLLAKTEFRNMTINNVYTLTEHKDKLTKDHFHYRLEQFYDALLV